MILVTAVREISLSSVFTMLVLWIFSKSTINLGIMLYSLLVGGAKLGPRLKILVTEGGMGVDEMLCTQFGLDAG